MNTILNKCLKISQSIGKKGSDDFRTGLYINNKISEEIMELLEEIDILENNGTPGKDGVLGETVDIFISCLDMYHLYYLPTKQDINNIHDFIKEDLSFKFEYNKKIISFFKYSNINRLEYSNKIFKSIGQCSRVIIEASLSIDNLSYKNYSLDRLFYELKLILSLCINMFVLMSGNEESDSIEENFVNIANKKLDKWVEKRNINI